MKQQVKHLVGTIELLNSDPKQSEPIYNTLRRRLQDLINENK